MRFNLSEIDRHSHLLWEAGERLLQTFTTADSDDAHLGAILAAARLPERAIAVDMGCGFGELARLAARRRPDVSLLSLNISAGQLQFAPEPKLLADFTQSGLADDSFSAVFHLFSIGHADAAAALKEAHRVLKPGGRLVIFDLIGPDRGLEALAYTPFGASEQHLPTLFQAVGKTMYPKTLRQSPVLSREQAAQWFLPYTPALWVCQK